MSRKDLPDVERKVLTKMFWRSNQGGVAFSLIRQMGYGCLWIMYPYLNWLYPNPEDKEKKIEALKRESVLYNITAHETIVGPSLFATMEKEYRNNEAFDPNSINALKVAIMGPLSGIGDALMWVTLRVIAAGVGISFAQEGSILGPILFLLIFNVPHYALKWFLTFYVYQQGERLISQAFESGLLNLLTKAATIMGLVMVGAMIAKNVSVPIALSIPVAGESMTIQSILDGIMPGLLPLLLTFGVMGLLRKRINVNWLIISLMAIGILGGIVGLF